MQQKLFSFLIFILVSFICVSCSFAQTDETLTITTYYPAPYGVYNELRSKRMAIGDNWFNAANFCWAADASCVPDNINADADLVVEGNVGIGTTEPTFSIAGRGLHIAGITGAPNAVIRLVEPTSLLNNFEIRSTARGTSGNRLEIGEGSDIFLTIRSDDDGGGTTSRGNVGIGTAVPDRKLAIEENAPDTYMQISNTAAGGRKWNLISSGTGSLNPVGSFGIQDQTTFTTRLVIDSSGNVGIGTTNPASSLHVIGMGNTDPSLTYRSANAWSLETGGAELVGGILTVSPWTYWLQTRSWASAALPLSLNPLGGNVGIGTTTPGQKLDVNGTTIIRGNIQVNEGWSPNQELSINSNQIWKSVTTGDPTLYLQYSTEGGNVRIGDNAGAANSLYVYGGGYFRDNVGIGTAFSAVNRLYVSAAAGNNGIFGETISGGAGATVGVYGNTNGADDYGVYCQSTVNVNGCAGNRAWVNTSDVRLKTNIRTIDNPLAKVGQLRGVNFEWKSSPGINQMGFIAQEVLPVVPEIVGIGMNNYYTMSAGQLTALLVEAVKELKTENNALKQRIEKLEEGLGK